MNMQADEDAYLIKQAEALKVCDGRRQALVDVIDAAQDVNTKGRFPIHVP